MAKRVQRAGERKTPPPPTQSGGLPKGFELASDEVIHRLLVSVSGLDKTGKSHFALTTPGPIVIFDLDVGLEGVVAKFRAEGKQIFLKDFSHHTLGETGTGGSVEDVAEAAKERWEQFKSDFLAVLGSPTARTVIWDTATEAWELARLAHFGKLAQVMPIQYGPVNAEFRGLIRAAYEADKNLILVHKVKPLYLNDKRTGRYERAGFSDIGFLVQVNLLTSRDEDGAFVVTIENCRHNSEVAGEELTDPMTAFPFVACEIMPDTDVEDWE